MIVDEKIGITQEDKKFKIVRSIVEEVEAKEFLEITKNILDGLDNANKQKEDAEKQIEVLNKRISEFNRLKEVAEEWNKPITPTNIG